MEDLIDEIYEYAMRHYAQATFDSQPAIREARAALVKGVDDDN